MSNTFELAKSVSIVDVASRLGLRRDSSNGKNNMYFNPFGTGKDPSISINEHRGLFNDFSSNRGGTTIDLVMFVLNFSNNDAAKWICEQFNLKVEETRQKTTKSIQEFIADQCIENIQKNPHEVVEYLKSRGISENAIHQAIHAKTLGFNTFISESIQIGQKGYGGNAVAFIVKSQNGQIHAVDNRYLNPANNGGMKTKCNGDKNGNIWVADWQRLKYASTVVICESSINALSVDSLGMASVVGIAVLGTGNTFSINYNFLEGKRVLICFDKDGETPQGKLPGQEASWALYEHLCDVGITCFLVNQNEWRKPSLTFNEGIKFSGNNEQEVMKWLEERPVRLAKFKTLSEEKKASLLEHYAEKLQKQDIDFNDILKNYGVDYAKKALFKLDQSLIPGVIIEKNKRDENQEYTKTRVRLPNYDQASYWRFQLHPSQMQYLETKMITVGTDENGKPQREEQEIPVDVAGFRIANFMRVQISGFEAAISGVKDDSPESLYVVTCQTRRNGFYLGRHVFRNGLHDMQVWEKHFGAVFNPKYLKQAITIMENLAQKANRKAANLVGLAWVEGKLQVNQGTDCYFQKPEQQCTYHDVIFHSGHRFDAKKIISAYQRTFRNNAALMMLTWTVGTHLKLLSGFYPHLTLAAEKGTGKSFLIDRLGITTGMKKFTVRDLTQFRLRTAISNTSFPIAFDEISNASQDKRLMVSNAMQTYTRDWINTTSDMIGFLYFAPMLIGGEDVADLDNAVSKTVRATLKLAQRGEELQAHLLPKFPMVQWLTFLSEISRETFNSAFKNALAYCMGQTVSSDATAMRMVKNYALQLVAWRLLCEFADIPENSFGFIESLMSEMNSHLAATDTVREPWVIVIEKLFMEITKAQYPYPFIIKHWANQEHEQRQCLTIKLKEIMDFVNSSSTMSEFRKKLPISSANALRSQLKNAGVIWREPVHPYIEREIKDVSGKIVTQSGRFSNYTAIDLKALTRFGLYLDNPEVDYSSELPDAENI